VRSRTAIRCQSRYAGGVAEPTQFVSLLRRMLPFFTVVLVAAVAYDGWVFYALKILSFYATPGAIHPGERASLCYGVTGATSVRMEPAIEDLHPALTYCMQVSPAKDTEYKLIAEDDAGHTTSSAVTIHLIR